MTVGQSIGARRLYDKMPISAQKAKYKLIKRINAAN